MASGLRMCERVHCHDTKFWFCMPSFSIELILTVSLAISGLSAITQVVS